MYFEYKKKQKEHFSIPVVYWLAKSKYEEEISILAIYLGEVPVGIIAFALDIDDGEYWIYAFMIDEKFQGNGYSKLALSQLIDYMKSTYGCKTITIGHQSDNLIASKLYSSYGFKNTGEIIEDEVIKQLKL